MLEVCTRYLIVVSLKKQKRKKEGRSTNECTVNMSLKCIIIFDAVHCNKDHLNYFVMVSKKAKLNKSNLSFSKVYSSD